MMNNTNKAGKVFRRGLLLQFGLCDFSTCLVSFPAIESS